MTDIVVTPAYVAPADPMRNDTVIRPYIAAVAITKGQAVYALTSGKAGVADANDSGKEQFRGIALNAAGIGQAVDVLEQGDIEGFTLTGNAGALAYLSNTAGAIADAAGAMTVPVGRIVVKTDSPTLTKVLRVFVSWMANWS